MSFGPLPNISYPISPLLDSSTTTVFNTSDAYSQSEEGIRASVPIDSKMYEAILEGIENFGGDWEIDDSAKNVYTPGNSIIPVNCSDACGIVEWHPHFTTWFGKFEGSGVEGSLSVSFRVVLTEEVCLAKKYVADFCDFSM